MTAALGLANSLVGVCAADQVVTADKTNKKVPAAIPPESPRVLTAGEWQTTKIVLADHSGGSKMKSAQWTAAVCRYPDPDPVWTETQSSQPADSEIHFRWQVPAGSGIYQWQVTRQHAAASTHWWSPAKQPTDPMVVQTETFYVDGSVAVGHEISELSNKADNSTIPAEKPFISVGKICPSQSTWSVIGNWRLVDASLLTNRSMLTSLDNWTGRGMFETLTLDSLKPSNLKSAFAMPSLTNASAKASSASSLPAASSFQTRDSSAPIKPVRPTTQKTPWGDVSVLPPGHAFAASLPSGPVDDDHRLTILHPGDQPLHLSVQWISDADPDQAIRDVITYVPSIADPSQWESTQYRYPGFGPGQIRIVNLDQHSDARFASIEVESRPRGLRSSVVSSHRLDSQTPPRDCLWFADDSRSPIRNESEWSETTRRLGRWKDFCKRVQGVTTDQQVSSVWIDLPSFHRQAVEKTSFDPEGESDNWIVFAAIANDIVPGTHLVIGADRLTEMLRRIDTDRAEASASRTLSNSRFVVTELIDSDVDGDIKMQDAKNTHSRWIQNGLEVTLLKSSEPRTVHRIDRSRMDANFTAYDLITDPDATAINAVAVNSISQIANHSAATGSVNGPHGLNRGRMVPSEHQFLIRHASSTNWRQDDFEEQFLRAWRSIPDADWNSVASLDSTCKTAEIYTATQSPKQALIFNRAPWQALIELKMANDANSHSLDLVGNGVLQSRSGGYHHVSIPPGGLAIISGNQPIQLQSWTAVVAGGINAVDAIKTRVTKVVERVGRLNDPPAADDLFSESFDSMTQINDGSTNDPHLVRADSGGLHPWLHSQHPVGCVAAVVDDDPRQNRCAQLSSHGSQTARTWMVSETVIPDPHGCLAVSVRCRTVRDSTVEVDSNTVTDRNEFKKLNKDSRHVSHSSTHRTMAGRPVPVRLSIEGIQDDAAIRISHTIELPPDDLWHDESMILEVGGLSPNITQSLRLTIDLLGPGTVRIDDIRIHSRFASAAQRADLQQLAFLAVQGLKRGNLTHSAHLLQNPYSNELLFRHEYQVIRGIKGFRNGEQAPLAPSGSTPGTMAAIDGTKSAGGVETNPEAGKTTDSTATNTDSRQSGTKPDKPVSVSQRIRDWLPRPMRF